jgi:hypothetical protein
MIEQRSPHSFCLVLAGSHHHYRRFLQIGDEKLNPRQYIYLYELRQLHGVNWNRVYLIKGPCWEDSLLLKDSMAIDLLNLNFPGWNIADR